MERRLSIRAKLLAYSLTLVLFVAGSITLFSNYRGHQQVHKSFESKARHIVQASAEMIAPDLYFENGQAIRTFLKDLSLNSEIVDTYLVNRQGVVLSDGTEENSLRESKLSDDFSQTMLQTQDVITRIDGDDLQVAKAVVLKDGTLLGFLQIHFSLASANQRISENNTAMFILTCLCFFVAAFFAYLLSRSFSSAISQIAEAACKIGQGELDTQLHMNRNDELRDLAEEINSMAKALSEAHASQEKADEVIRSLFITVKEVAAVLVGTAREMSVTVAQHEQTASSQLTEMQQVNVITKQLEQKAKQSAQQAGSAETVIESVKRTAQKGSEKVKGSLQEIVDLKEHIEMTSAQIVNLSEKTGEITNIISLVNNITDQTNLLALNAAVEAARAGEHGQGFAVVAAEIRELADQSKQSMDRIYILVDEIRKATSGTVQSATRSVESMHRSVDLAKNTEVAFQTLSHSVEEISDGVGQIALNAKTQASAVSQIFTAISSLSAGTQETVEGISQTKHGIDELDKTAQSLNDLLEQ